MCIANHNNQQPSKGIADKGHGDEHRMWSRRAFLQTMGIAGVGAFALGGHSLRASQISPLNAAMLQAESDNILVLIRLSGGNDGLNTVIPIAQYDLYRNARPNIYLPESKILELNAEFGVPSYMRSLESLWGEGQMKVVHGVGYENHNLSHFTSSDIYANTEIEAPNPFNRLDTGWMGRYFESLYPDFITNPPEHPAAIQIGSYGNLIFEGEETNYAFISSNVDQLEQIAQTGLRYHVADIDESCMYGDQLKYLRNIANMSYDYADVIHDAYERGKNDVEYQKNYFARQMALIARLIKGNLGTKVYMVTMGGFDTHGNQPLVHERLMSNLSVAVKDFFDDLTVQDYQDKVLGMTFSEFGRRIHENGSKGTDHGTAAPTLFFGGGLNGSAFIGEHPRLDQPIMGDNLAYTQDFRDLYATILAEWLCVDPSLVSQHLLGRTYTPVNLGFNCSGYQFPPDLGEDDATISHMPVYPLDNNEQAAIELKVDVTTRVEVELFNIVGQNLGTIFDDDILGGRPRTIDVRARARTSLAAGQYIYRVKVQGKYYSKSIQLK